MSVEEDALREAYERKVRAFKKVKEVYKEVTGGDLCEVIEKNLKQMPYIIRDLAEAEAWTKLRTEINRAIDLAKLLEMCRRV